MGWLTPAVEGATGGLWGMNDAEGLPGSGPPPHRAAWFQVMLTGLFQGDLLPVQPFLACAGDAVARPGRLRLDWAGVTISDPGPGHRHRLIRRNRHTGELAFYRCYSLQQVTLAALVTVAGLRWTIEENFQAGKAYRPG